MADQTLEAYYFAGQGTLQLALAAYGASSYLDSGFVLTEDATVKGIYRGTRVGVSDSGPHTAQLLDAAGADLGTMFHFNLANTTGTYRGQLLPIDAVVAGGVVLTEGSVQDVLEALIEFLETARPQPGQDAPPAAASTLEQLDRLYKAWRNKSNQDDTTYRLFDDAGTTVDQQAPVSEASGTVTRGKIVSGA